MKDPYVLEDGTLKNKLGITDYNELNRAEKNIIYTKLLNVSQVERNEFDTNYLKALHKHLFEDIFEWAGEFRTVPIYKTEVVIPGLSLDYTAPKKIEKELKAIIEKMNDTKWDEMASLDEKSMTFTKYLSVLWKIHPFRDGNTRTTLAFGDQFAREHGFSLNFTGLLNNLTRQVSPEGNVIRYSIRDRFVLAAIPDEYDPEPEYLDKLLKQAMKDGQQKTINTTNLKTQDERTI